jgi:predicted MFS family arabinose efflux permease
VGDGAFKASAPLLAASLTSDPRAVATVAVASASAWLMGLLAGAVTDRLARRMVLSWTDLVRAVALGLFVLFIVTDGVTVGLLALVAFVMTTGTVFVDSGAQAMLPSIVGTDLGVLSRQNGRLYMVETTSRSLLGLPLGSAAFTLARAVPFAIGALTYACSALTLRRLPREEATDSDRSRKLLTEIGDGLRYLVRDRILLRMSLLVGLLNLADSLAMAVFVLYAKTALGVSDFGYGMLLTCFAAGSLPGGFLAARLSRVHWTGVILLGAIMQALTWIVIVTTRSAVAGGLMLFAMGIGATVVTVSVISTRQALVPDRFLGRVVAGFRLLGNGFTIIGAAVGGVVAAHFGLAAGPWAAIAVLSVVAASMIWLIARRTNGR